MELWVGKEYMFSDSIMLLIVLYFFLHCIRMTIIVFRDGAGMWQDNKWQPIVSATFNLIVNIILVQVIGLAGILISSIASMILIDIPWETHAFCKRIKMKDAEYLGSVVLYFIVAVLATGVTALIASKIEISLIVNLILKGCLCIVIPNVVIFAIYHKKTEFVYFVQLIKRYAAKIQKN